MKINLMFSKQLAAQLASGVYVSFCSKGVRLYQAFQRSPFKKLEIFKRPLLALALLSSTIANADQLLQLERNRGQVKIDSLIQLSKSGAIKGALANSAHLRIFRNGENLIELAVDFQRMFPANGRELASIRVPNLSNGDVIELRDGTGVVIQKLELDLSTVLATQMQFEAIQLALRSPFNAVPPNAQEFNAVNAIQSMNRQSELQLAVDRAISDPQQSAQLIRDWQLKHLGIGGQCGLVNLGSNNQPPGDFRFPKPLQPTVTVSGRFVSPGGIAQPNLGAFVYRVTGANVSYLGQISVNGAGQFAVEANVGDNLRFRPYGVQPPLVQLAEINASVNNSASVGDLVIPSGATLTARIVQSDGQVLTQFSQVDFYNLSTGWTTFSGTSNGLARLGVSVNPPHSWELTARPSAPYVGVRKRAGTIGSDVTFDLVLPVGVAIPGRAITSDGGILAANAVRIECSSDFVNGEQTFVRENGTADGNFTLNLVANVVYRCSVSAPAPYIAPTLTARAFASGDRLDFALQRASDVSVQVLDPAGAALSFSAVMTSDGTNSRGCYASPCRILAETNLPNFLAVDYLSNSTLLPPLMIGPRLFADETVNLAASQPYMFSGTVTPSNLSGRVRIYTPAGVFLTSTVIRGTYSIPLRNGSYRYEMDFTEDYYSDNPATVYRPVIGGNIVVNSAPVTINVQVPSESLLNIRVAGPCLAVTPTLSLGIKQNAVELVNGNWLYPAQFLASPGPGQCRLEWRVRMPLGNFQITPRITGWTLAEQTLNFTTPGQNWDLTVAAPTRVWSGRVVNAAGQGVGASEIFMQDAAQRYITSLTTSPNGDFSLPLVDGALVEFSAPQAGRSVRKRVPIAPGFNPPATIQLENIDFQSGAMGSLERLFGDGNALRYNIVFVAESYTTLNESYTDSNGNGTWDGVAWLDLNSNGIYDNGDYVDRHGAAPWPQTGSNPTAANEAFVDTNADGFPNRNEQSLFRLNSESYMRALLGSDVWERHREKFNAYLLFLPSQQAGYDVINPAGQTLVSRNTRFNAAIDQTRDVLGIDYNGVISAASAALPEMDLAVALVNQPISAGRANAGGNIVVYYGGWNQLSPNGTVQSHEMGHAIGRLADEYTEFSQILNEWPIGSQNSARTARTGLLPWRTDLPAGLVGPSRIPAANGIFEGSSYAPGGAYRPSYNSKMRGNSPLFNAVSARAIEARLVPFADGPPNEIVFSSGFEGR